MRNLIAIIAVLLISVSVSAQETAAELKNAGNAALRAKDFATAISKYESYMSSDDESASTDKATIYNMASCYDKLGKDDKATEMYNKCIEMKYKGDLAMYKLAGYKKEAGDTEGYIGTLKKALEAYPKSRYKKVLLSKITKHYNKLAQAPYNDANKLANAAAASGDAMVYLSKMKKALVKFDEAKEGFSKTLEVDPDNKLATSALSTIDDQIKAYKEYKKSLQN